VNLAQELTSRLSCLASWEDENLIPDSEYDTLLTDLRSHPSGDDEGSFASPTGTEYYTPMTTQSLGVRSPTDDMYLTPALMVPNHLHFEVTPKKLYADEPAIPTISCIPTENHSSFGVLSDPLAIPITKQFDAAVRVETTVATTPEGHSAAVAISSIGKFSASHHLPQVIVTEECGSPIHTIIMEPVIAKRSTLSHEVTITKTEESHSASCCCVIT
jgi:hypothetical protein